jgi:hypothetical protein
MDSTLVPLFTVQEILERLGSRDSTGALHVFTFKESANIFFERGRITGAMKGLVEGEEVVRQLLDWKDARLVWQPEIAPATPLSKPVDIDVEEFFARTKTGPQVAIGGKKLSETPPQTAQPIPSAVPAPRDSTQIPRKAVTARAEPSPLPVIPTKVLLTATKQLNPSQDASISHEVALLKKHPLVLVSDDDPPAEYVLRLTQLSSLIGRNPACDFPIDHTSVSRQHCLLQITDRGLHVKDLGTTNGTKVNGIVMTEGYINVGDTLSMGKLSFTLERDASDLEI